MRGQLSAIITLTAVVLLTTFACTAPETELTPWSVTATAIAPAAVSVPTPTATVSPTDTPARQPRPNHNRNALASHHPRANIHTATHVNGHADSNTDPHATTDQHLAHNQHSDAAQPHHQSEARRRAGTQPTGASSTTSEIALGRRRR